MNLFRSIASLFRRRPDPASLIADHWFTEASREPIPGGAPIVPQFLVIHFTAGARARSSIEYWRKLANGICAHFVIERDGEIIQCRPTNVSCGHAGKSSWIDRKTGQQFHGLNAHSIGIELANGGNIHPTRFSDLPPTVAEHKHGGPTRAWETYPPEQIEACKHLSRALVAAYGLRDIIGHDDIAPGRKLDAGPAFPMDELRKHVGLDR